MHWIATPQKDTANAALEKNLWDAADQFRANSGLKAQEYSGPILGLIFLRFAAQRGNLEKVGTSSRRGSRLDEPDAYHAQSILYLAPGARFDFLLSLPEGEDIGAKVNAAMREVEKHNPRLAGGAAQDLQPLHRHAAQEGLRDPGQRGLRRLRPHLRVLPR